MKTEEVFRIGLQPLLRDNGLKWAGRIHSLRHFAASRRIGEELGVQSDLKFVYKFEYQARFNTQLSENELCSVYFGRFDGAPAPNPNEVQSWKWISKESLTKELRENTDLYTPWLKLEWSTLNQDYAEQLKNI